MRKIFYILLFISAGLFGQSNIFVSTTGDDGTGDGSIGNPYKTLTYTENEMRGGGYDTMYIRGGVYTDRLRMYGYSAGDYPGATAASPTVVMPYNNESVTIQGDTITMAEGSAIIHSSASHTKIIDLEIMNIGGVDNDSTIYAVSGIILDDHADSSYIIDCIVHDSWNNGIQVLGDYDTIDNCTVYDVVEVNNKSVRPQAGLWGSAISINNAAYGCVKNCTVYEGWGEGISAYTGSNVAILDNVIYDVWSAMLYISDAQDCVADGNLIYQTGSRGHNGGIVIWDEGEGSVTEDHIVTNNIVVGCYHSFVSYNNTELVGCTISNNNFISARPESYEGTKITASVRIDDAGTHTGAVFANNIIIQGDTIEHIYISGGSTGITFNNNLYDVVEGDIDSDATDASDVYSGDPDFKETGGDSVTIMYYQLSSGSDADGAGTDEGVTVDINDVTRPDPPSIGAWEVAAASIPTVLTLSVESWTTGAQFYGNLLDDGNSTLTGKGFCVSTSPNPTTGCVGVSGPVTTGLYSMGNSGLVKNTTYYVRAYATNGEGTAYGEDIEFSTASKSSIFLGDKTLFLGDKLIVID